MLDCFTQSDENAIPIVVLSPEVYPSWLAQQNEFTKNWLASTQFRIESGSIALIPNSQGNFSQVICCVNDKTSFVWAGVLPNTLPPGRYYYDAANEYFALAWGMGAYQFVNYKMTTKKRAQLCYKGDLSDIENKLESIYLVRDLINIPAENMGPSELSQVVYQLAKQHAANFTEIVGDDLIKNNYESIHTVGRASDDAPRLLDLRWGQKNHPKVTLVGKGVCFDSGGLNIKNAQGMLLMKKDMGGAANVLGLAKMIMQAKLPIQLRVLIPAVENVISGNAYRPGDVIKSRKGLTIEVSNTDAEGRIILADTLTEACSEKPDLLIDISTLTGAARIALGTDLPVFFSNDETLALDVQRHADEVSDPMWRLPLYEPYREALFSAVADINNSSPDAYAGAITAALFLKEFVPQEIIWLHLDLMAWNLKSRPAKPQGGEAMAIRGLFSYLAQRFA